MAHAQPDRLLRTTLAVNALSSGTMGVAMAIAAAPLSDLLGIPAPILVAVGIALVPFALVARSVRSRPELRSSEVRMVIAADLAWVIASIAVLAVASGLTTLGAWAVGLVALAVADYAVFQWLGLRRVAAARAAAPDTSIHDTPATAPATTAATAADRARAARADTRAPSV